MLRTRSALGLFAVCLLLPAASLGARGADTGFLNRTITIDGAAYHYQVYVPREWNKHQQWPVILFLHGYGEEGDDGVVETEVGIGTAIRKHVDRFPCVVVFPQCRKDDWWTNPGMQARAIAALDATMRQFKGDPSRVYLTGLSMGGYGTWALAAKLPGRFAAIVPICGGIKLPPEAKLPNAHDTDDSADPYAAVAQKIGKTPAWVFNGGADPVVPPSESHKMVEALKALGSDVRYTEYPGVGHNSWDKAYDEPELLPWMLSQQLQ